MVAPLDQVMNLRQQGYTNDQIIQALQRDGYTSQDIYDAMSQADVKGGVDGGYGYQQQQGYPQQPVEGPSAVQSQQIPPPPGFGYDSQAPNTGESDKQKVEELVEAVIDEKWNDFVKKFDRIVEWKENTGNKISQMEEKLNNLEKSFNTLHENILGKVGEYDENLSNVSNEIKAMEKVFQKVIPKLTENVNELSHITKEFKQQKQS